MQLADMTTNAGGHHHQFFSSHLLSHFFTKEIICIFSHLTGYVNFKQSENTEQDVQISRHSIRCVCVCVCVGGWRGSMCVLGEREKPKQLNLSL